MLKTIIKKITAPFSWIRTQIWYFNHGIYQGYLPMTEKNRDFNYIYQQLLKEEEILESQITRYATGAPDAKLSDIDDTMKRIKSHLKDTRAIAIEKLEERKVKENDMLESRVVTC